MIFIRKGLLFCATRIKNINFAALFILSITNFALCIIHYAISPRSCGICFGRISVTLSADWFSC